MAYAHHEPYYLESDHMMFTKRGPIPRRVIIAASQIICPVCHAQPGEFCRAVLFNGKVREVSSHGPRVRLAEDAQRAFDKLTG